MSSWIYSVSYLFPAPCSPQSLAAETDCGSNSLLVSWNSSFGASSYTAKVMGPHGFSETCSSSDLSCSFFNLQCATQYSITVASKNNRCTSAPIQTTITTGVIYIYLYIS